MNGKIVEYCAENNTTMSELSRLSGVSRMHLYLINRKPQTNTTVHTIESLYKASKSLGRDLTPDMYLDYEVFKNRI